MGTDVITFTVEPSEIFFELSQPGLFPEAQDTMDDYIKENYGAMRLSEWVAEDSQIMYAYAIWP